MRLKSIAAALAAVVFAGAAGAQSIAGDLGTSGVGLEVGFGINPYLGVRGTYGAGSYSYSYTESDIRYDAKAKPNIGMAILDVHPFGGVFRLSGGMAYNDTRIEGTADSVNGTFVINGVTYNTAQVGTVDRRTGISAFKSPAGSGPFRSISLRAGWQATGRPPAQMPD
ncbi:MAG TPA: hypothetical protein VFR86_18610, partial [Burkholderiaceae bacterium]|nr:hypothetical protein [Burkholderiaceae bacterium]